jgi:uncharacterized protein (TIGR03118 family)
VSTSDSTVAIHHSDLFPDDDDFMRFLKNPLKVEREDEPEKREEEPEFAQKNLVSDAQPGHLAASIQDPNLINPWGVAFPPTGPFWVANNHTGTSTLYNVDPKTNTPTKLGLVVTIATPQGQTTPASPTGVVFNDSNGFVVDGAPSRFIFVTEDGTLSAWNSNAGTKSVLMVDNSTNTAHGDPKVPPAGSSGAVYKGLAIGQNGGQDMLYAANFRHGTVDMFNDKFQQVGSFTDTTLPAGYAPFNAQVLDNHVFVTFALQDTLKHDDVSGAGHGFVDEFDMNGHLISRVESNGPLNSPWGLAIAPQDFGKFAGDLLVGNFGDGTIHAFDLKTDMFVGTLRGVDDKPITIGDLWAIKPGNNGAAGSSGNVFFSAGVQGEAQGLFGSLTPMPDSDRFSVSTSGSHIMAD